MTTSDGKSVTLFLPGSTNVKVGSVQKASATSNLIVSGEINYLGLSTIPALFTRQWTFQFKGAKGS
jgi:hypothetical protein